MVRRGHFRILAPWGAVALSVLLAILAWRATSESAARRREQRFASAAEYVHAQLTNRLQQYDAALDAACLLFAASEVVEPHEWETFVVGLHLPQRHPEIVDIAYLEADAATGKSFRVKYRWRDQGDWLDAALDQIAVATKNAGGLDDSIFLIPTAEHGGQTILVQPLQIGDEPTPVGWAALSIDRAALLASLQKSNHLPLRLRLTQGDESAEGRLVFDSHAAGDEEPVGDTDSLPVDGLGKPLCLNVAALPYKAETGASWPLLVFMLGLTATGLLFAFVWASQRAQRLAEGLARNMTASLRAREAELESYTAALQQANESLEAYSMSALQATHAKTLLLANTSHELRTPLTVILGFGEMLRGETLAREVQNEALDAIVRSGTHLLQLIDDLLDLSKIEAGSLSIAIQPCALAPLVADVVAMVDGPALAKGLALVIDRPETLPETICTDERRLRQILINLLNNAIKFTAQGSVQLSVRCAGTLEKATLECTVHDTGIGMSPQQLSRVFRPFTQGDSQIGRRYGGTGLGLAISRQLAELLGGTLTAESVPEQGSVFHLSLPVGDLAAVPQISTNVASSPSPAAAIDAANSAHASPRPLIGRCVLLAEDGPDNRRLLRLVLEKAGVVVTAVENGYEAYTAALEALNAGKPFGVILMDMEMPVLNGYEATRRLRAEGYRGPIVALTANAMHVDAQRCLDAGCNDYATKPINRDRLIELVARHTAAPPQALTTAPTL